MAYCTELQDVYANKHIRQSKRSKIYGLIREFFAYFMMYVVYITFTDLHVVDVSKD